MSGPAGRPPVRNLKRSRSTAHARTGAAFRYESQTANLSYLTIADLRLRDRVLRAICWSKSRRFQVLQLSLGLSAFAAAHRRCHLLCLFRRDAKRIEQRAANVFIPAMRWTNRHAAIDEELSAGHKA